MRRCTWLPAFRGKIPLPSSGQNKHAVLRLHKSCKCFMLSSGWFTGICSLNANVSEHYLCYIFIGELVLKYCKCYFPDNGQLKVCALPWLQTTNCLSYCDYFCLSNAAWFPVSIHATIPLSSALNHNSLFGTYVDLAAPQQDGFTPIMCLESHRLNLANNTAGGKNRPLALGTGTK
jgi:hypothetical protein